MIFGHEGGVRAGKSYEAVLYHVVPALKAGRHVYARLNGIGVPECMQALADYVQKPLEEVQALVHPMGNDEVREWLVCNTANDGTMDFPHIPRGALVVVDEAHEYWPVGRAALPDRVAEFFAKHGHASMDIVVLTQDVKELHRSIVRRMTKKNFYAKLDSLGEKFDKSYSVRFYSSPSPGKFELITSEKRDYDPQVWRLYQGVLPGIESNEVYKGNTTSLWKAHRKKVVVAVIACVLAIVMILRFFTGGGDSIGIAQPAEKPPVVVKQFDVDKINPQPLEAVTNVVQKPVEPKREPGEAFILDMVAKSRPRYLGSVMGRHLVEFRATADNDQVLDRMTGEQLQALGWTLTPRAYGLDVVHGDTTIIFTAWPIDPPLRISEQTRRDIREAGAPVMSASESQPRPADASVSSSSSTPFGGVARYGASGISAY